MNARRFWRRKPKKVYCATFLRMISKFLNKTSDSPAQHCYDRAVLVRHKLGRPVDDFFHFFPRSLSISRTRKQETRLAVTNATPDVRHH